MKKVFIEPQIRRIELNMKENIANSEDKQIVYVLQAEMTQMCLIQDTNYNYLDVWTNKVQESELAGCATYISTYSIKRDKTRVTREELFGY